MTPVRNRQDGASPLQNVVLLLVSDHEPVDRQRDGHPEDDERDEAPDGSGAGYSRHGQQGSDEDQHAERDAETDGERIGEKPEEPTGDCQWAVDGEWVGSSHRVGLQQGNHPILITITGPNADSGLPRLDAALTDVLDTAAAVLMVGVETRRAGLRIQRDGAFLGVTAADDPRPTLLVGRKAGEPRGFGVAVGLLGLLVLLARRLQFGPQEPFEATTVAHTRRLERSPQRAVGTA